MFFLTKSDLKMSAPLPSKPLPALRDTVSKPLCTRHWKRGCTFQRLSARPYPGHDAVAGRAKAPRDAHEPSGTRSSGPVGD